MGRAPCCDKDNVKRGPWSPEEDAKLKSYIEKHGTGGNWIALPPKIGLKRCGKSCRLRWLNYLRPNIKHGGFSEEEDDIICRLYISIGSRWSVIAAQLPGRTDNDVKNYWNTRLKKKLFPGGNGRLHGKDQNHGRRRPVASAEKENQQKLGKERNFTPAAEDRSWKASVQSQLQALLHNRELATVITGNPSAGQFPDTGDSAGQLFGETPPQPTCHGSQLDDLIPLSSLGDRHRGSISTPQGGEALQGADASCMMPELAEMFIFNTANLEGLGGFYGLDYHTEPIGESSRTTTSSQSLSWEETMSQASGLSISDIRFPVFAGGAAGEEQCSPASYINLSTARMELM